LQYFEVLMITILPEAILDDRQRKIIAAVEPYAVEAGVTLTVTRGHSSPVRQLKTIENAARDNDCLFSEFISGDPHAVVSVWRGGKEQQFYAWQQTWSALLFKGIIINPPLAAVCLEHYVNAAGVDMMGQIIYPSPHIKELDDPKPCPIDFSARVDRLTRTDRKDIALVTKILTKAKDAGVGIRFIKPEPKNVCVHCDTENTHDKPRTA
jgi:hypothetical protein